MLTDASWWKLETQKTQLIWLRREADIYFNFDLFEKANAEFEKAQLIGLRTEADV